MQRPAGIRILTVFYVVAAVLVAFAGVPVALSGRVWSLFGAPVGPQTYAAWNLLMAVTFLGFAWSFHKGLRVGLLVYTGLKVAGWVILLGQGPGLRELGAIGVEAAVLGYLWQQKDWFRG